MAEQQDEQDLRRADGGDEGAAVEHTVDDVVIDGRMTGVPPNYAADDADDPSAQEAAIQADQEGA